MSGKKIATAIVAYALFGSWSGTCISAMAADALLDDRSSTAGSSSISLKGVVSEYVGPAPDELLEQLVQTAVEQDKQRQLLLDKSKHYHGITGKVAATTRQVVQMATEYRGFELSSEAADVILDEKIRLKSQSSVDYAQQKNLDEYHTKIYSGLMHMAQGLGMSDAGRRSKIVEQATSTLKEVVGEEEAQKTARLMTAWSEQIVVPPSYLKQESLDVMEIQGKIDVLVKQALGTDPVVSYVRRVLHRYNVHKDIVRASAKVINTTLSFAMYSPTVVAPAAQLAAFVYSMSTGGPEETKLLKELYLDKRLDSRYKRVNTEVGQALNGYNAAVLTQNPTLLAFTESMMSAISGEDATANVLGNKPLVARKSSRDRELSCMQGHGVF